MRLVHVLWAFTLILAAVVCGSLWRATARDWEAVRSGQGGLLALEQFQASLDVAEKISRERGPGNTLLASPDDQRSRLALRLAQARAATDEAFVALDRVLARTSDPHLAEALTAMAEPARSALARARAELDRVAVLPFESRTRPLLEGAVKGMFAVVPLFMQPMYVLCREAQRPFPDIENFLEGARNCAELREFAGQLGSQFAGVVVDGQALDPRQTLAILRLQGRCEELRDQLAFRVAFAGGDGPLGQAHVAMEKEYFGEGEAIIASLFEAGSRRKAYPMGPGDLVDRYVPRLASIEALRRTFIAEAYERARRIHAERRQALALAALGGGLGLATVLVMAVVAHFRIVAPLVRARKLLARMAEGDLDSQAPAHPHRDEVGEVFAAVEFLRQRAQERRTLARERDGLLELLSREARLDFLTGLPNRRGFEEAARNILALARRHSTPTSLALLDVDFFKKINDTCGHPAGDRVLKGVAETCRKACREGDVVARYGGEEFVILMPYCDLKGAWTRADQIRAALEAHAVELEDGSFVQVTASLGVAAVDPEEGGLDLAISRADEALYRAKAKGRNRVCWFGQEGCAPA